MENSKRTTRSKPVDPRRKQKTVVVNHQPTELRIIRIWTTEKETQTEPEDFTWTQQQQNEYEEFKRALMRFTVELFTIVSPEEPDQEHQGQHGLGQV